MSYVKQEKSDFIRHAPCPDCGSRDNLAVYTNHTYCFGCHQHKFTDEQAAPAATIKVKEKTNMICLLALTKNKTIAKSRLIIVGFI